MASVRKDNKGRKLETGERYDSKNNRYVFQKMVDGERTSITAQTLSELRKMKYCVGLIKGERLIPVKRK